MSVDHFFVKFDGYKSLYPQYVTQAYLFGQAANNPLAPHIPEVYHYFRSPDSPMAYLVMERIKLTANPDGEDFHRKVASALQWLRSVTVPDEATIGRLGGGLARHALFKDFEAPLNFSGVEALQKYINAVRHALHFHKHSRLADNAWLGWPPDSARIWI